MRTIVFFWIMALAGASSALAGMPAPVGYWMTQDGGEELLISGDGCRFHSVQGMELVGTRGWDANSSGGILTITYPSPTGDQHVRWSIDYVNEDIISVFGDIFYRH